MENHRMFFPESSSASSSSSIADLSSSPNYMGNPQILDPSSHSLMVSNERDHYSDERSLAAAEADNSDKMKKKTKKTKKPKYAFQTRSQVDILDDGYRWRKYGQKAVKANKFPRSYYRCTYEGCNVKKQVQRLDTDEGIVVTTYEGVHSHSIDKPNVDTFEHILTQMQHPNYTGQAS